MTPSPQANGTTGPKQHPLSAGIQKRLKDLQDFEEAGLVRQQIADAYRKQRLEQLAERFAMGLTVGLIVTLVIWPLIEYFTS